MTKISNTISNLKDLRYKTYRSATKTYALGV